MLPAPRNLPLPVFTTTGPEKDAIFAGESQEDRSLMQIVKAEFQCYVENTSQRGGNCGARDVHCSESPGNHPGGEPEARPDIGSGRTSSDRGHGGGGPGGPSTFCFDLLTRDTPASGAILEIETTEVTARCSECGQLVEVKDHVFLCPQCGGPLLELVSGRELSITSIEGETGNGHATDQDSCRSEHPPRE